jgi:tRNA threonylcarbamoyladenosine biosynthesis protein TsaB
VLLALETSTRVGCACLWDGEQAQRVEVEQTKEDLAARVHELVAGRWADIRGYAVSIGPGSFTGLRLGVSLLKGIAFVHPRPVAAVPSLQVWAETLAAEGTSRPEWVVPVVRAKKGQVYTALFRGEAGALEPVSGVRALADAEWPEDLPEGGGILGGSGLDAETGTREGPWIRRPLERPDVLWVARIGARRVDRNAGVDAARLEPHYAVRSAAEAAWSGEGTD